MKSPVVLCVDDDIVIREFYGNLLSKQGYRSWTLPYSKASLYSTCWKELTCWSPAEDAEVQREVAGHQSCQVPTFRHL